MINICSAALVLGGSLGIKTFGSVLGGVGGEGGSGCPAGGQITVGLHAGEDSCVQRLKAGGFGAILSVLLVTRT